MKLTVWPSVETHGELEPAEGEWLHTNGAGAYSMSTLALMHTRRFHGLLVAALDPPLERYVIVSHAETTVEVGKRLYSLSTHQFPDVAPTPGYRLLESFSQDPLPRWVYRLGKGRLERTLALVRGENALVTSYTWTGKSPARLKLRPLLPMRPIHALCSEQEDVAQQVTLRRDEVWVQPIGKLPKVVFGHRGVFMGSPDWWRRFEYPEDRRRHVGFQEDLWTPGTFEVTLEPNVPSYVTASLEAPLETDPACAMEETRRALLALDPGEEKPIEVRALSVAAEQFRVPLCARPGVIAGYPWLGMRSRDTLLSLPGLYLVEGLFSEAIGVLRTTMQSRVDGLLTTHVAEPGMEAEEPCVDSSLWLFEAVRQLRKHVSGDGFIRDEVYPVLREVFARVTRRPGELVWVSEQGLLAHRSEGLPSTWMDSRSHGEMVTPRHGLAVEMQALWSRGCDTLSRLATEFGEPALAGDAVSARDRTRSAFRERYWCHETNYAYDCISDIDGSADSSVRPNALIALSVEPELFESWQAESIVARAREKLLTPAGLRTLAPGHPSYIGYYEGGMDQRRAAYHQGVAWGYLVGALARAALRTHPDDFELQVDVRGWLVSAMQSGPVLGQIAQISSGDFPYQSGGCPAQAWTVAELLRTFEIDLGG